MTTWRTGKTWRDWVGLACRFILGFVLLIAGALKFENFDASILAVSNFQMGFPYDVVVFLGYALPIVEVLLGLALIFGFCTRMMAFFGGLMMAIYAGAIVSVWVRGIALDCGCFGGGGVKPEIDARTYFLDIMRDIALAAMGLWLIIRPHTPWALDNKLFGRLADVECDDDFEEED